MPFGALKVLAIFITKLINYHIKFRKIKLFFSYFRYFRHAGLHFSLFSGIYRVAGLHTPRRGALEGGGSERNERRNGETPSKGFPAWVDSMGGRLPRFGGRCESSRARRYLPVMIFFSPRLVLHGDAHIFNYFQTDGYKFVFLPAYNLGYAHEISVALSIELI